jgi:flavorubredoxin
MAFVRTSSRPASMAGKISTFGDEKLAFTEQPRLHWPQ